MEVKKIAIKEAVLERKTDNVGDAGAVSNHELCKKNRAFGYETHNTEMGPTFYRAGIVKRTIVSALQYNIRDPKDIKGFMAPQYPACGYPNYQQMRIVNYIDHKKVMRYLADEPRKNPIFPRAKVITFDPADYIPGAEHGEKRYRVNVDVAFPYTKDGIKGKKIRGIELICYKLGKAEFTATGAKNALVRDIRLYLMILMGRMLGYEEIKASYYYLTKSGDSSRWAQCPQSFFGGGGNVVSLTDTYNGKANELDKKMAKQICTLLEGIEEEDQCKEDCQYCDKFDLCKFSEPPRTLEAVMAQEPEPKPEKPVEITLTPEQQKVVEFMKGVMRVNAGAGAGKTMTVAKHIQYLVDHGVKPDEICCTTFTNAGAKEMRHRAEKYAKRDLTGICIQTINSFLNDVCIAAYDLIGLPRPPKVISDVERFRIISDQLNKHPIYEWQGSSFLNFTSAKNFGSKGALRIISDVFSYIKKSGNGDASYVSPRDVRTANIGDVNDCVLQKIINMYDEYQDIIHGKGLIDFDDQELLAFKLFDEHPEYLPEHFKFKHLIVDEFQDSSEGNIRFIKYLKSLPTFESLLVVGDDCQAIFGFRNTSPEYIIHFEKYIGCNVEDVFLEENHRSTPQICDFANKLIAMNTEKIDKKLIATRPSGVPVIVNGFYKQQDEDAYIVEGIQRHIEGGMDPHDIAVITYTKTELRRIADKLTKAGIPSMFAAPEPKMENPRIRAILAFSRVIFNRSNTKDALVAANAVAHGGIMDLEDEVVKSDVSAILARAKAIDEAETLEDKKAIFFNYIDDITDDDEMIEDFKKGMSNKDFDEILEYCSDFTLYGGDEEFRRINEYPGVVLITAHSSKGLEYPVVYNSITKYMKEGKMSLKESEERRRLLFVSATRARDELYVTGLFANGTKGHYYENIYVANSYVAAGRPYTFDISELD